ncbi:MAG: S8 family serine peptidase [Bdellovibrionaceae bacterium]|nr:S8 family serine peptidase [Pseudobdellovibrionaceae bacterium]
MTLKNKLVLTLVFIGLNAFSARVAVTDSGTDFSHEWLAGRVLTNTAEIAGNRVDDDRNGKVDDILGWNFADNYGKVFFREHVASIDPKIFTIMDILSRIQSGNQTPQDDQFWKENITNLNEAQKKAIVAELNYYGQYSHSTHVSGIIASLSPESRMISNRVFPDTPLNFVNPLDNKNKATTMKGISDWAYRLIAMLTNGTYEQAAAYIAERQIDVANYSIGVNLQMLATLALTIKGVKNPTPEQIMQETKRLFAQYELIGQKWLKSASKTLFVIAAGNDGTDNDKSPVFPSNVAAENRISVAASQGVSSLAKFSNYGLNSVDVAAPGVAIKSSVPSLDNKLVLPMSGTSMAAPYVTGVAAHMKDINPQLTPPQLRQILMGTVDKKDWLKEKVASGGVVNAERAYAAAEKSKVMTVALAIEGSMTSIPDQKEIHTPKRLFKTSPYVREMRELADQIIF